MIKYDKLPRDILSKIPEIKELLLQDDNIVFAYLFGGLAKGEVKSLSDIDLAVYLRETDGLADNKIQLFGKLTDALGTA